MFVKINDMSYKITAYFQLFQFLTIEYTYHALSR